MDQIDTKQMDLLERLARVDGPIETQTETANRISDPNFVRTNRETRLWLSHNGDLRAMHEIAVEDYVTSRHAILDLGILRTGLALAAQSIEKFLKSYLLASGLTIGETRQHSHRIVDLLEKAHERTGQDHLLDYSGFCENLQKWYNSRYPDSNDPALRWMRNAVPEFDRFVCFLEEHIPLPTDIEHLKFGGGDLGHSWSSIFVRLFGDTFSQHRAALLSENGALITRIAEFETRFLSDRLAAGLPATTLRESREHSQRVEAIINEFQNDAQQADAADRDQADS
ncbi:MAG: HEPN domain-containing protein [Verrucomicrobiales bacterium]|nr:HEPN domain-containing protein [Verrucomicrobiales bacterium]